MIDPANAFQGTDIEGVLSPKITGMRGLDLAPGLVVELLLLQRLDLSFGENDTLFGNLGFEHLQAGLEVGQVVAHPDRTDPAGGDEDALLAQLVGDPDLAVGRIVDGVFDNGVLGFEIDPVLEIGRPARPLQQRLDAAILDRVPVAVKCIARQAHDLTGLRDIAELFR